MNSKTTHLVLPVYVPNSDNVASVTMGTSELTDNKLTIEFDETFFASAIQRMLSRGELLGVTFVQLDISEEASDGQSGDESDSEAGEGN